MTPDSRRVEVDPERLAGWVDRFVARHGGVTTRSVDGGLVLTAPDGAVASLVPPWPWAEPPPGAAAPTPDADRGTPADAEPGHAVSPRAVSLDRLLAEARRSRVVAVLLVRRGGFAVAVAEGAQVVASKVGQRHVQGKTKAGGWSQQRFARRREGQAKVAFAAAADHAASVLLPHLRRLDGLVTGGDRTAVTAVLADPRLRPLGDLPQGRFLAVPDPRRRVLEDAVRRSRAVAIDVVDPLRD